MVVHKRQKTKPFSFSKEKAFDRKKKAELRCVDLIFIALLSSLIYSRRLSW